MVDEIILVPLYNMSCTNFNFLSPKRGCSGKSILYYFQVLYPQNVGATVEVSCTTSKYCIPKTLVPR